MLVRVDDYDEDVIAICPKATTGNVVSIGDLYIALPSQPPEEKIEGYGRPNNLQ